MLRSASKKILFILFAAKVTRTAWAACMLCAATIAPSSYAQRKEFKPASTKTPNLIRESEALSVLQEQSVQSTPDQARRIYSLMITSLNAQKLTINSNENRVTYPVDSSRGAIGAQWAYLPIHFHGFLGVSGMVHYTYLEEEQQHKTALHWMIADLHLLYRYERSSRALLKPFVGIGGGTHVFIQRGPLGYDTSEAQGVGSALLGLAWDFSRTLSINSPLNWELTMQYKRVLGKDEQLMNLNGDHFSLGLELAL